MDGIVLLAKNSGKTSFSSLYNVKKALGTTKVGHTGTLDSFAQGLLVVCVGKLTKLAGNITEFNKSYSAVIKFGFETDTLEYTGNVIKSAPLPTLESLKSILEKYIGKINQTPPIFSSIHIDGKRASDIARNGGQVEIKSRQVEVFENELVDYKLNDKGLVEYCQINFSVSKGTYIRSLARDIANDLNSAGHLVGLYRTKVGNFDIKDACGYKLLNDFSIDSAISLANAFLDNNQNLNSDKTKNEDLKIQQEISSNLLKFNSETAALCGFEPIFINESKEFSFKNGKPLLNEWFEQKMTSYEVNTKFAVFTKNKEFIGLISKKDLKHLQYVFVIN